MDGVLFRYQKPTTSYFNQQASQDLSTSSPGSRRRVKTNTHMGTHTHTQMNTRTRQKVTSRSSHTIIFFMIFFLLYLTDLIGIPFARILRLLAYYYQHHQLSQNAMAHTTQRIFCAKTFHFHFPTPPERRNNFV